MAKNDSTCTFRVEESEIREYLDKQVREAVKQVLEEIMNAEAEELICAGPYERSESRRDHRRRDQEAQDQDQGGGDRALRSPPEDPGIPDHDL